MWHWGWGWWMGFGMVLFWAVVGLVIWLLVRGGQARISGGTDPSDILAERFARGEISEEEFEERRRVLAKR